MEGDKNHGLTTHCLQDIPALLAWLQMALDKYNSWVNSSLCLSRHSYQHTGTSVFFCGRKEMIQAT